MKRDEQQALKRTHALGPLPAAESFWESFRVRAAAMPREDGTPARIRRPVVWLWAPALAALVLGGVGLWLHLSPEDPAATIQQIKVVASHTSVFVLEDLENDGTIVWVNGLHSGNSGG